MHDMNFFAPFQGGRKAKQKGSWIKVVIVILFAALIIAPLTLFLMISNLNSDIEDIQGVLRLPKNEAIIKELESKSALVAATESTYANLQIQELYVQTENWFTEELLKIVVDAMPKQVRFTSLTLTTFESIEEDALAQNGFSMTGVAADRPAVAEMEYNLRNTGLFDNIFVYTIADDEGNQQFDLQFSVKDGANQ